MANEDIAVTKFREYLRVKTEHPTPDYVGCQRYLFNLADELGIARRAVEACSFPSKFNAIPGKPFIIMTIPGSQPELKSVVLYSHTDVVPAVKDQWKYDPYSAHKDEHGNIYGRGAQDMKSVGSQYFEAIRRHFQRGKKQWPRTIHIVWAPDEELGGVDGMQKFVKMEEFRDLKLGFMLDEGLASETSSFKQSFINSALSFREEQRLLLKNDSTKRLGDVITLNITKVEGGVQVNVVPDSFTILLDVRTPPTADLNEMEKRIASWCTKAGAGVTYEFIRKSEITAVTPTTSDDPFWSAFEKSLKEEKCSFDKEIFPGSTDSRFVREVHKLCFIGLVDRISNCRLFLYGFNMHLFIFIWLLS
ncbi:unnamed protein product [Haemonchus placei]|uniref:M20_dimer domain-containing protein n=1 Tax=Haemonchus placei TaxID=6290 RepID=A0A0N4X5A5_HAEPC|nr:unnamed protein product [Haemonchus placei]